MGVRLGKIVTGVQQVLFFLTAKVLIQNSQKLPPLLIEKFKSLI
jgi:hypothetical protein